MTIGFAFDSPVLSESESDSASISLEYEDQATIDWIKGCLGELGDVVDLPWGGEMLQILLSHPPDVIFNITEAGGSRNRESLLPAIAEALDIPFTGSGAVSLGISLDKYLTKVVALHRGIHTPRFVRIKPNEIDRDLRKITEVLQFPLMVKPTTGGSSVGIRETAKVYTFGELRLEIEWGCEKFSDGVLVEEFVAGREFTAGILDRDGLITLPIAEIRVEGKNPQAFYSIEKKRTHSKEVICPVKIETELADAMNRAALDIFRELDCVDLARVDFRVDDSGIPQFLEINPLPGLSPHYSIFPIQTERAGIPPEKLVHQLIHNALHRAKRKG